MPLLLDAAGLSSAAVQLSGSAQVHTPAVAEPPGADATSASAVAQLNAASTALAALLSHGSAVREVGALAVSNTAAYLTAQDDANAAGIASGSSPASAGGPGALPNVPSPTVPTVPAVPAALAPLPGEAHAQALYGGPGSSSLHSFADQWDRSASQLRRLAESTRQTGDAIDASWDDAGHQRAGANTRRHGEWLSQMSDQAGTLAGHARSVAESFESAKQNTPSPQEFAQARQELQEAMARFAATRGANAGEVQERSQNLAFKQTQATSAATTYHSSVNSATLSASMESMKLAPPIAGGGGGSDFAGQSGDGEVKMVDWKPGDQRHYPIIRGEGGLGPAQPADGPGWVEVGPRSGIFVRPDELPGMQVLTPGGLGPAAIYDGHGNSVPYLELGKGSGVWVPQSDFPGAQIQPPGAMGPYGYEEFIPGTGIWLPREDLVPDPADPAPPSGATYPM